MDKKVYSLVGIFLLASLLTNAQIERMPYGASSFYSVSQSSAVVSFNAKNQTEKWSVVFYEGFEDSDNEFNVDTWELLRSTSIEGTDLAEATSPKWFLCKPTSFSGNGSSYIFDGQRSAAISYTAPDFTWLVIKEFFAINSDSISLNFWINYFNNPDQDIITNFNVLIQEEGFETWQILKSWDEESANNQFQQKEKISLADYKDKNVRIAFVYENINNTGYQLAIDEIFVGIIDQPILQVSAIPFPFTSVPKVLVDTMQFTLSASIRNNGLDFTDTVDLKATISLMEEFEATLQVTDTIKEGEEIIYSLEEKPLFEDQGNYVVEYNLFDAESLIHRDTVNFYVTSNLFATDLGVIGGFSMGEGKTIGNLYPIKRPVLASAVQIGWSSYPSASDSIPFGIEIFELNPLDSSLTNIYSDTHYRFADHANNFTSYLIEDTYLAPGTQFFVAVKQFSQTPIGIGYDNESTGHFWSLNSSGELERFSNPAYGNLAIRLMISEPSTNNALNLNITDGENPIENASVQVEGLSEVLSDASGNVSINLSNGRYTYKVVKEGFAEVVDTVKILYASVSRTVVLKPEYLVSFTFSTAKAPVANVEILVSGKMAKTNDQGMAELHLTAGMHNLTAMLAGYIPVSQEIEVTDGTNDVGIEMVPGSTFSATFTISDEFEALLENVLVSIEGYGFKLTDENGKVTFTGLLPENEVPYTLYKYGLNQITGNLTITDSNIEVSEELEYIKYNIIFEVTNGVVPVYNAQVSLNGYSTVFTNFDGLTQINQVVPSESIDFSIAKTGYATYNGTVSVIDSDIRMSVVLSPSTSIPSFDDQQVRIYPNPTSGIFTIETSETTDIKVYDLTGRLIFSNNKLGRTDTIDISSKPSGVYIVKIVAGEKTSTLKIVKR